MKNIRTSKFSKIIACYLALQLIVTTIQPYSLYATGGPSQPEFNSFTPIGTSDMVNLSSGDFNYNIPIMDVGGYPLNLAYNSGITMDQEASWVGLGWNLNVGQINRQLRGLPDDFDGDLITNENNMRTNFTAGFNVSTDLPIFGKDFSKLFGLSVGVGVKYNNYNGLSLTTNYGPSFNISDTVNIGLNISNTSGEGVTVTPRVGINVSRDENTKGTTRGLTTSIGIPFNSRQGMQGLNLSASASGKYIDIKKNADNTTTASYENYSGGGSSFLSFNDNLASNPTNKLSFINANLTLNFGVGLEIFGAEPPQQQITGFGSLQALRPEDKEKKVKGYGYANTENGSPLNSMLDFNRENDRTVTKNTTMLPMANQTYDLYSIQGQGIGGMFRPYRSQVGHVYDRTVAYFGTGIDAGYEVGPGAAVHIGADIKVNPSSTRSGRWNTRNEVLNKFILNNKHEDQKIEYEPVYYKTVGELNADTDKDYLSNAEILTSTAPVKIGIGGEKYFRTTANSYKAKKYSSTGSVFYETDSLLSPIKRTERLSRTQSIQMIKYGDVKKGNVDAQLRLDKLPDSVPDNHHIGIKVLKPDGSTYVFGETAYNLKKVESTFAIENPKNNIDFDCKTGLVRYDPIEDDRRNSSGRDHYFNRVTTPKYVHSYLLSSVLSSDYEDITNDGPTDDDLGAYTKFSYIPNPSLFNWRVPFQEGLATYSEGSKADIHDDKANYIYGTKEIKYVDTIQTKTHIAIFYLSPRNDGHGVVGPRGGMNFNSDSKLRKLDKIELYSKPEYKRNNTAAVPIKTAHFEYDYSLCSKLPNNISGGGKLTLSKVYFTYRNSKMGQYTPYVFNYEKDFDGDGEITIEESKRSNPDYHIKGYDVWGNYKPYDEGGCGNNDPATTPEFPFVQQEDKELQNERAAAWTLTSIDLPSGGQLDLEYETDDYGYVQNKKAMQMFKVVGAGNTANLSTNVNNRKLYENGGSDIDFLYVKINDDTDINEFRENYLGDIGTSDAVPLYFKFFVNVTDEFDFISGYAEINKAESTIIDQGGKIYGAIKLNSVKLEGGDKKSNGKPVNPISKTGWNFAKENLNRQAFQAGGPTDIDSPGDLLALAQAMVGPLGSLIRIFKGPNRELRSLKRSKEFKPNKSWVRLYHPDDTKFGGGIRVKKLGLHDNWDTMTNNDDVDLYKNYYGQEYSYTNPDGSTSGVATFEPNGSRENPLIIPFFDKKEKRRAQKYIELPVGQSLYPSPSVTYGRVTVENIKRERPLLDEDGEPILDGSGNPTTIKLKKHATGRVINEFFTTKIFPTITDYTDITPKVDISGFLEDALQVRTNKSLTYSQGFVVRTNDMDGKQKSQTVQTEGQSGDEFISKVEYKYSINNDGTLNNDLDVINQDGIISNKPIGVTYDMVNDFRSFNNTARVMGIDGNLAALFVFFGIIPVPTLLPVSQKHEQNLQTVTTTKIINSVGILKEKIAYDLGSKVSTENLAWDGQTGQVLLTKTVNEYDDNYYNLTYPANWYYDGMAPASKNLGTSGRIRVAGRNFIVENPITNSAIDASSILTLGDELIIPIEYATVPPITRMERAWVAGLPSGEVYLIDREGNKFNLNKGASSTIFAPFTTYRSGHRNLQTANMASVTSQENPIQGGSISTVRDWAPLKVVNASAVEYSDAWNSQCEFRLPNPDGVKLDKNGNVTNANSLGFNPYLYNVKGDWRAIKSYAYLTGRDNGEQKYNPRKEGFFKMFKPFYRRSGSFWIIDNPDLDEDENNKWTFASEVTQYSPYGAELENKDALNRHSAAQYGYRYTLPTAVGSNTKYRELAFDGFEDYDYSPVNGNSADPINPHFGFQDEVIANSNAKITSETSHSGRNSIRLSPGATAKITHKLVDCEDGGGDDDDPNTSVPDAIDDLEFINCAVAFTAQKNTEYQIEFAKNDVLGTDDYLDFGAVTIISQPSNGTLQLNENNSGVLDDTFTYTPNFPSADDSFTYQLCDINGDCDIAKVSIKCHGNFDPIINSRDDSISYSCSENLVTYPIFYNDSYGANGYPETGEAYSVTKPPQYGSITFDDKGTSAPLDDTVTYTRFPNSLKLNDSFEYQICDSTGACDTPSIVSIRCKTGLVAIGDDFINCDKEVPSTTTINVLENDNYGVFGPALDGSAISIIDVPRDVTAVLNADNTITITSKGKFGIQVIYYEICDARGNCVEGPITIFSSPCE